MNGFKHAYDSENMNVLLESELRVIIEHEDGQAFYTRWTLWLLENDIVPLSNRGNSTRDVWSGTFDMKHSQKIQAWLQKEFRRLG